MMKKILAAVDGSEHAWKALDLAADMAKQHGAQLVVLHVVPFEPIPEALRAFAAAEHIPMEEEEGRYHYARNLGDQLTRSAEARARAKGLSEIIGRTVEGKAADQILEVAGSEDIDMIVWAAAGSAMPALFSSAVSRIRSPTTQPAPASRSSDHVQNRQRVRILRLGSPGAP